MPGTTEKLISDIEKIIADMTRTQGDALAKRLSAAFVLGYKSPTPGTKEHPKIAELQLEAIRALTRKQFGYISEYNQALSDQLKATVQTLIAEGKGYEDIRREMVPYIETTWSSGTVTIDRTGQTRQTVEVDAAGNLHRVEKTIKRPYSASIETYSDLLSRTATHAGYEAGRAEGYKATGFSKWRFIGALDERTRPWHAALVGNIFEYGTDQSAMAEEILSEPYCRHRAIPIFDDPRLDTPASVFDAAKEKAGLEWKDGAWGFKENII